MNDLVVSENKTKIYIRLINFWLIENEKGKNVFHYNIFICVNGITKSEIVALNEYHQKIWNIIVFGMQNK